MKNSIFAAILFSLSQFAIADSFTILALDTDNGRWLTGIDASGDVVIKTNSAGCNGALNFGFCYVTFTNGLAVGQSLTLPDLEYQNTCASSIYTLCNVAGDSVWINQEAEEIYEAILIPNAPLHSFSLRALDPAPVPEPWSLTFVITGILGWIVTNRFQKPVVE